MLRYTWHYRDVLILPEPRPKGTSMTTLSGPSHRLAEVPLFARLAPAALDALASASRLRRYPQGQVLCNEGDPGDALLVLEEGQLRISHFAANGEEAVLAVVDPPTAVGELALLDGEPRSATIIAQRPVTMRLVPRSVFLDLVAREPAVVEALLVTLAWMVRANNVRYADVLGLDVPGRLAKWLLTRGELHGERIETGLKVALGRTQGELAAELGTTRPTLNRALHDFEALGLVTHEGDQIIIRNPDVLRGYTA